MFAFGGSINTERGYFLYIKKRGPFSLLCVRVYWELLPRIVYFIINKVFIKKNTPNPRRGAILYCRAAPGTDRFSEFQPLEYMIF